MIKELDLVVMKRDLPESRLKHLTIGLSRVGIRILHV